MKFDSKIALITLARATFDLQFARAIQQRSLRFLRALDRVEVLTPEDVLVEPEDAQRLADHLKAEDVDLVVLQSATYALGNLAVELALALQAPILLWGVKEPEMNGGVLRSNALVGMQMNASNLFKHGISTRYVYGMPEEAHVQQKMLEAIHVSRAIRQLKTTKLGMVGGRAEGFYNLSVDEIELRKRFGVEVVPIGLNDAFAAAHALSAEAAAAKQAELQRYYPKNDEIGAEALVKMARQFGGLQTIAQERHLGALTVRCWPEWAAQYGIAACGSVSALNSTGLVTGCEGDVDGTLTMLVNRLISNQPTFMADLISVEVDEGTGYFWHGGCAAVQLAAQTAAAELNSHFAGGKGITAGFTFAPGRITIVRISHDGQNYRLFLTCAEALPTEQVVKGVLMKVKFDISGQKLLDTIISSGLEHHFCVLYGNWRPAWETFAAWKHLPVIQI